MSDANSAPPISLADAAAPSGGPASDSAALEAAAPLDAADIAALVAASQSGTWAENSDSALSAAQGYDGHVALALDTGAMADIDQTLDLLTSSHQLFDVPALDVGAFDDASPV
jgi:hypothetical protein